MLMGMMQFMVHGIMINIKMKSLYNHGLGAVVFLHIPVGIFLSHYNACRRITLENYILLWYAHYGVSCPSPRDMRQRITANEVSINGFFG